MRVTVVGAGGHVGLPFSLVAAEAGHTVFGYDINKALVDKLNKGELPYVEEGAEDLLKRHTHFERLQFTTDPACIQTSDIVAIMIGTPVDSENNPRLDDLFQFVDSVLIPNMRLNQTIILRSTVAPGTTEVIRNRIESKTNLKEGAEFFLVFCPERVLQGKSVEETKKLPQIIGSFNDTAYNYAAGFFNSFAPVILERLTPREAEIAKLMTNMWRYMNFAFANEMWMIAEKQGVDIHKVITAANYDYPRLNVAMPGPNVGGPCLFKDGRFLLSDVPFVDLIQTSFVINEGMPDVIWNTIKKHGTEIKNVLILGAAFKANCDDTRNSLSYKMKKVCKKHGANVDMNDRYVYGATPTMDLKEYDAVIVMTPHKDTEYYFPQKLFRDDCIMADVWKMYPESRRSPSGIYRIGDI